VPWKTWLVAASRSLLRALSKKDGRVDASVGALTQASAESFNIIMTELLRTVGTRKNITTRPVARERTDPPRPPFASAHDVIFIYPGLEDLRGAGDIRVNNSRPDAFDDHSERVRAQRDRVAVIIANICDIRPRMPAYRAAEMSRGKTYRVQRRKAFSGMSGFFFQPRNKRPTMEILRCTRTWNVRRVRAPRELQISRCTNEFGNAKMC